MRRSHFWENMDRVFGPAYARSLSRDLTMGALDGLTVDEALERGIDPGIIWDALCDAQEIPDDLRWPPVVEPKKTF